MISRLAPAVALALAACAGTARTAPPAPPPGDFIASVSARTLYQQGIALARVGDLTRAEQYLAASIQRGAPEARVLPRLLGVCVAASRFRAAVSYARPYLENHPSDWNLRFLVGSILAGLGESQAARHELQQVLATHATHAGAHYLLGALLRDNLNDPLGADGHFRRYLELEPEGPHAEEARAALARNIQ